MNKTILGIQLLALCATAHATVISWPTSGAWNALYSAGGSYSDIPNDIGNSGHEYLDIVGDATYAAGFLLYRSAADTLSETEDQLLIRIRLDEKKNKMPGAYQVFFETDGDDSVEWVLQLNTTDLDANGTLTFGSASGTNRNGVVFGAASWTDSSYSGYIHYTGLATGDGSQFDAGDDYFLDVAMPWLTFSGLTGITSTNDPFRLLITSSQSAGQINDGDVGNSSVAPNTDFLFSTAYSETIPEPAVLPLFAIVGGSMVYVRWRFRR
ncbi:MAG: PEP-CTERM sorting domain-containing protein [Kiritimatiellales bacterium]|nr:PEP-CTERM sorting domain-containing protein [Kiritimatiellales bacterium]